MQREPRGLGIFRIHGTRGDPRVHKRLLEIAARQGLGVCFDFGHRAFGHDASAANPCSGTDVEHVVRATDGLFVMFDDEEGVPFASEVFDGVDQNVVVARMQTDRRFVEYVADAPQVGAEFGGETDALRFASGEGRRASVEREVAEADALQKVQSGADFRHGVPRHRRFAFGEAKRRKEAFRLVDRFSAHGLDGLAVPEHVAGRLVQTGAVTVRTHGTHFVVAVAELVPEGYALANGFANCLRNETVARTRWAGARRGIVGKEARIEFGEAAAANRAGALHRVETRFGVAFGKRENRGRVKAREDVVQDARAFRAAQGMSERCGGQFDCVQAIALERRDTLADFDVRAVDAQTRHAHRSGAFHLGAEDPLAVANERHEERHVAPRIVPLEALKNLFGALGLDRNVTVRAVLRAELHVQETQEVVDLRHRGYRRA